MMSKFTDGAFKADGINSNGVLALDLHYDDGHITGTPLTYMGPPETKIGGQAMVRQLFTVTNYSRTVDGVWLSAYRKGVVSANLLVRLERPDGFLVAGGSVPRLSLPAFERDVHAHRWTRLAFAQPCQLHKGQSYALRLSAASGPYYARAGITAADRGDFKNRNIVWTKANARAQHSSNGGASWSDWDIPDWNSYGRPDMSLALLFTVVPG